MDASVHVGEGANISDSAIGAGASVTNAPSSGGPVVANTESGSVHVHSPVPSSLGRRTSSPWSLNNILAGAVASIVAVMILWLAGAFAHMYNFFTTGKP